MHPHRQTHMHPCMHAFMRCDMTAQYHVPVHMLIQQCQALLMQRADDLIVYSADNCKLKVTVHHGVKRDMDPYSLAQYDVVFTTYQTLRSEHRRPDAPGLLQ